MTMPLHTASWSSKVTDAITSVLIVLGFSLVADIPLEYPGRLPWLGRDMRDHLGAEYHNIALAVLDQRGFSDPFRIGTGPTAWMSPVLPYITVGIYRLVGLNQSRVVDVIYLLQLASMSLAGGVVLSVARGLNRYRIGIVTLMLGFATEFFFCFQMTHDVWLLTIVVNLLWLGICRTWDGPAKWSQVIAWGLFGGLSALCSPVMGAAWAVLTSLRWWNPLNVPFTRDSTGYAACLPSAALIVAALVSMVTVAPWTVRNYRVFGEFVPIKSNAMFELWQAQVADDDGVFDQFTLKFHPNASYTVGQEFAKEGEIPFIENRAKEVKTRILAAPLDYLERMANRFADATAVYTPFDRMRDIGYPWKRWLLQTAHSMPLICLCVCVAFRRPLDRPVGAAIGICLLVLLPYVLVSYYARYAAPLLAMKLVVVVYGIDTLINHLPRREHESPHADLANPPST